MGSKHQGFVDVAEAARALNCTKDRIENLCHQGTIRHQLTETGRKVHAGDVEELRRLNASGSLPMTELSRKVLFLESKVQRLEEAVNILFEINGMSASRFSKMTDSQLVSLYHVLERDLDEEEWPTDRLLNYCEIFIRISEGEIHRINEYLDLKDSWKTFYDLLLRITKFVANRRDLDTDLDLQRISELLTVGRKNIRDVSRYFIERSGDSKTSQQFLAELASNDVDMFNDLAFQLKSTGRRGHLTLA